MLAREGVEEMVHFALEPPVLLWFDLGEHLRERPERVQRVR